MLALMAFLIISFFSFYSCVFSFTLEGFDLYHSAYVFVALMIYITNRSPAKPSTSWWFLSKKNTSLMYVSNSFFFGHFLLIKKELLVN